MAALLSASGATQTLISVCQVLGEADRDLYVSIRSSLPGQVDVVRLDVEALGLQAPWRCRSP